MLTYKSMSTNFRFRNNIRTICFALLVTGIFSANLALHAEPWKCGTPLLCEHLPPIADFNLKNLENDSTVPAAPVQLGQIDRFYIHIPKGTIQAKCVAVGTHCYIYIENDLKDMLSQADANAVAKTFDTFIYAKVQDWIGSEFQPGLDRDNRITILFHDVGMNASGQDYGGYFSPIDLHPTHATSNRRDMLYMDIFQFKERARHTFYSSLAHEFAHLINWYQNGGTTDQRWLEEGIASFVEWGVYRNVHTLFVDRFLATPSMSLTTANTNDVYYGAAFMLLLYLYENNGGKSFIRQLAAEDRLGLSAIDNTLGNNRHFVDVFLNWALTNWINNPVFGKHNSYQNLPNRKVTASTPRVSTYPKTVNNVSVDSWGTQYVLFENLPQTLELTLQANSQAHLYSNIVYLDSNRKDPIVKPVPYIPDPDIVSKPPSYNIKIGPLKNEAKILLIVTTDYSQTFDYAAKHGTDDSRIDISEFQDGLQRNIEYFPIVASPQTVTYSPNSSTEPISQVNGFGTTLIPSNLSVKLEPKTQIHLSSDFQAIAIHEGTAFAASDWGLEIFSLNGLPKKIGEIATPGNAQAIAIDGGTAYVADGASGIHIIDVNQPTSPRIIKTVRGFQDARGVHLAHGNLYALDTARGLLVYRQQDLQNIQNPHPKRTYKTVGTPLNVSTNDEGIVFLSDNAVGLYILTPDPLGGFTVTSTFPLYMLDFEIGDRYAHVASGNLEILNVSNTLDPTSIAKINTPGMTSSVTHHQGLIYLTDKHAGLHIVDAANPLKPHLIASHPTIGNAEDLALWIPENTGTKYALIADGMGGIQTFDVSNPYLPQWINHYDARGIAYGIDIENSENESKIAVANGIGGLKIIELTDPFSGKLTQNIRSIPGDRSVLSVQIEKQYAYIGIEDGMSIVDIELGETVDHIKTSDPVWAIALIDDYAYLCAKSLIIVDISDPDRSRIVSRRELTGSAYNIAYNSSHAYVASLEGGVHLLDITEPSIPRPIAHFPTEGAATNVTLAGEHIYVLDTRMGLLKFDGSDLPQLTLLSNYGETRIPIAAATQGEHLYLLDNSSLQIIDTRTMLRLARYSQFQSPTDLVVTENAVYVTDLYQLRIFRANTNPNNLAVEEQYKDFKIHPTETYLPHLNQLSQNFPNPFNPETWIPYSLAKGSAVTLSIYDGRGRRISHQQLGFQHRGKHLAHWDGRNTIGEPVASGIYFYTITAGSFSDTRKMVLQR